MGTLDELVAKDAAYRAKVATCAHDWTRVGEHSCECPRECARCDISELWWLREQVETLAARERDHMNAMASLTAKALEAVAVWQQRTAEAYERAACACEDVAAIEQTATLNSPIRRLEQAAGIIRAFKSGCGY